MVVLLNLWNLAAAVLWYRYLRGRVRYVVDKQSSGVLVGFFVAGVFSVLVTLILHYLHPALWFFPGIYRREFFFQVLVTGVVEEWAKWLCFIMAVHGGGTIKEPQDGILQAAAVGLGFGTVENIAYIARYPGLWIAIRPFVATGGHMIYAAFWGGFYSAAVYSNVQGRDPQAYRLAVGSVFLVALIHGSYNALLSVSFTLALLPDVVLLVASVAVFLHMVRRSPYRRFELSEAGEAIAALETGLAFNRKSTILNRRMGLYRMYRGEYTRAASYFARAIPRAKQPTSLRFFKAVCEYAHLGGTVGKNALRKAWALLDDRRRSRLLSELERVLVRDPELLREVRGFLNTPFSDRRGKRGYALAKELKERKARRRRNDSPTLKELVEELSEEERLRMNRQLRTGRRTWKGPRGSRPLR